MTYNEAEETEAKTCCGGCGGCGRHARTDTAEGGDTDETADQGCRSNADAYDFLETLS